MMGTTQAPASGQSRSRRQQTALRPVLAVGALAVLAACTQPDLKFNAPERSDAELCAAQAQAAKAGRTDGVPIAITCPGT